MQAISRIALTALIVLATCLGSFALVGCGGSSAASAESEAASSASAASADAAASAADDAEDEDQDNCYGDDLPAKKS